MTDATPNFSRRAFLALPGALLACHALAQETKPAFAHPGGLHARADLDRMRAKIAAREQPWLAGYERLVADRRAQPGYRPAPRANLGASRQRAQDDASAAYLLALRWHVAGDARHADAAARILDAWSAAVDRAPSGPDQPGLGGIPIGTFALAGELLGPHENWHHAARFRAMLRTHGYPVVHDFLARHNGAHPTTHWANWDAANVRALLAIGVLCDDRAVFDEGVDYFRNGAGMGSVRHAVPFLHPGGLGQWQEAGRDHAHALGGLGLLAETCQVAWNQGVDLFAEADDRLLAGAEYLAQHLLWVGVPYRFYTNRDAANQHWVSPAYRGGLSNAESYELLHNHYVVRQGKRAPNVAHVAALLRPEGGNVDLVGFGTLAYTLDAARSPLPTRVPPTPLDVTARAGVGRVELAWSPSGAYAAQGYEVSRARKEGGPYEVVHSTTGNTTPRFVDEKVEAGATYHYVVAALNQVGASAPSAEVSAAPAALGALPDGWAASRGEARYADALGGTFVLAGHGADVGGAADDCQLVACAFDGDVAITARYAARGGPAHKVGVALRASADPAAAMVALTLGERGGRQARVYARARPGARATVQRGHDYAWPPTWLRLQRAGEKVGAQQSPDGVEWFTVGEAALAGRACVAGFVVSGGNDAGEPVRATFDHVEVAAAPPPVPAAPSGLSAGPGASAGVVRLAWFGARCAGVRVEASADGALFYEIADLLGDRRTFDHTGVEGERHYRVRAYTTGGFSAYSNAARGAPR